jgi:hypothetical protein
MHDLPSQTLLQQANARPVSGEELEVFGKAAASRFMCGDADSLNDAVVETVKQAALSPEQVRRVIEFANTAAYLQEFKKEGATHKYIHFDGGPASPTEVLKDLNDGGGGTVFDRGSADYFQPPPNTKTAAARLTESNRGFLEKNASVKLASSDPVEAAFERMFHVEEQPLPYAEPWAEAEAMREKLATTRDNLNSELSFLEGEFRDITDQLYDLVKQAAMEGVPLSHVIQSWTHVTPGPGFVKAAFSHIGPRLAQDGVMSLDGIGESLTKHAAAGTWNPEHPLPGTFAGFCSHLTKLAEVREQRDVCHQEYERLDGFIKKAGSLAKSVKGGLERAAGKGGLWHQLKGATRSAGETAGGATQQVGEALLGKGSSVASGAGKVVGKGVEYAPEIGGALAAKEMYDQVKYRPSFQLAKNVVQSRVPYTHPYMVREYQLQQNAGGMF